MLNKSLNVPSNTHYYEIGKTRLFNRVPNCYSFTFKSMKCNDYYVRSYFEYNDVLAHGGFTCFLTLTYNNNGLPRFLVDSNKKHSGIPCFSSTHINLLIHALRNRLNRKFNTDFTYLITKEYGSKRSRPHYHALFFVKSNNIKSYQFIEQVKQLWQGPISLHKGDYKRMKRGLVYAGENFGVVSSHHALEYACKYAVKDITANRYEYFVFKALCNRVSQSFTFDDYLNIVEDWLNDLDEKDNHPNWISAVNRCGLRLVSPCFYTYEELDSLFHYLVSSDRKFLSWFSSHKSVISHVIFKDYKNSFSCKPQHSNCLGLSALNSPCLDKNNGTLSIRSGNNKVKVVPVPLYIYRKLFYEKPFVDLNTGNVKYILSSDGIQHKLTQFSNYKDKLYNEFLGALSYVITKFPDFTEFFPEYSEYINEPYPIFERNRFDKIINYLVVYSGRLFDKTKCESLDLHNDYLESLKNSYYTQPFRNVPFSKSSCKANKNFVSYAYHPDFVGIEDDVSLYNAILNYHFTFADEDKETSHELHKRVKEAHTLFNSKSFCL